MIIFRDLITGDELWSDAYPVGTDDEDFCVTCKGKNITRRLGAGISDDLIGGNPSQEEGEQQCADDEAVESGIDFVLAQGLEDKSDFFSSKKILQNYLKKWAKNVAEHLKDDAECCEKFKKDCGAKLKSFLDKWNPDCTVYAGPHFDPEDCKSSLIIATWDDDGMGIKAYAIRGGICEEKC